MISRDSIDFRTAFLFLFGIDAEDHDGLALQTIEEFPFMGIHVLAGTAPSTREGKHDDLASVLAQREPLAFDVLAIDLRGNLADRQIAGLE